MSSKSDYLETNFLNHALRGITWTAPAAVYAALFTTTPGEAGGGTEVSGGAYARQAITFGAPASGQVTNTSDITFPTATGDWGTITGMAIFDAVAAGNMLYYSDLTAPRTIATGDQFKFPTGQLIVVED